MYRHLLGKAIGKRMRIFSDLYDAAINGGFSKERAFFDSLVIFKSCVPFHKISETEWQDISNAFVRFDDPKAAFIKVMLLPSWKACECLKNPDFLKGLHAIKDTRCK